MTARFDEDDTMTELMERRWFAMDSAAGKLRDECEALAESLKLAEAAWEGASARLKQLEAMRDALGDALANRHHHPCLPAVDQRTAVIWAA